jgi:hypothetical protein
VLFLLSFLLLSDVSGAGSSTASIVNYRSSADRRRVVLVGLYLTPLAGIAFVWFIVASTPCGRPGSARTTGSPNHESTAGCAKRSASTP